jgi:hypothetical protein
MTQVSLGIHATQASMITNLNYLMQNSGLAPTSLTINQQTGVISNQYQNTPIGYFNQWLFVAYATNATGTENFSIYPTNATYYGLSNQTSSTPNNPPNTILTPQDYLWYPVGSGGFGTTNFLFYSVIGGRQVEFYVGPTAPNNGYLVSQPGVPINLSLVTISQISDNTSNSFSANTAITVTGNAQPNITSVGTLTSLNVSGQIKGVFFTGDGGQLNSLTAANVVGNVSFARVVVNNAQPNITSVGTLNSLTVSGIVSATGNIRGNNFNTNGLVTATGNVTGGNLLTPGSLSVGGNILVTNFTTGNITANKIVANIVTAANVSVTGQLVVSGSSVFNSNINAQLANIQGFAFYTFNSISAGGNIRGGNIKTQGMLSAAGTVASGGLIQYGVYTRSALTAITGSAGQVAAVSDSVPGGQLAYWNTTGNVWAYVATNAPI